MLKSYFQAWLLSMPCALHLKHCLQVPSHAYTQNHKIRIHRHTVNSLASNVFNSQPNRLVWCLSLANLPLVFLSYFKLVTWSFHRKSSGVTFSWLLGLVWSMVWIFLYIQSLRITVFSNTAWVYLNVLKQMWERAAPGGLGLPFPPWCSCLLPVWVSVAPLLCHGEVHWVQVEVHTKISHSKLSSRG